MSTFPGSPRLLKGAIIGLDPVNPLGSVMVFQYSPDTMKRRLEARTSGGERGGGQIRGAAADRSPQGGDHAEYHFRSENNDPEVQGRAGEQGRRA